MALVVPESIVLRIEPLDFSYSDKHWIYKLIIFIITTVKEILIYFNLLIETCIGFFCSDFKNMGTNDELNLDIVKDIGEESLDSVFLESKKIKEIKTL